MPIHRCVLLLIMLVSIIASSFSSPELQEANDGLSFEYTIHVTANGQIPTVSVLINGVHSRYLKLVISPMEGFDMRTRLNTTWYDVDSISAHTIDGFELSVQDQGTIAQYYPMFRRPIHYRLYSIDAGGNTEIRLDYPLNKVLFAGFLETLLIRPQKHADLDRASLIFELPDNWVAATVTTEEVDGVFDLGTMASMYGDNEESIWDYVPAGFAVAPEDELIHFRSECGRLIFTDYPTPLSLWMESTEYQAQIAGAMFDYLCEEIGPSSPFNARVVYLSWPKWISNQIQPGLYSDYWQHNRTIDLSSGSPSFEFYDWQMADIKIGETIVDSPPYSYDHFAHTLLRGWINSGIMRLKYEQPSWFVRGGIVHYYQEYVMSVVYGPHKVYERFESLYQYYLTNLVATGRDRSLMNPGNDQNTSDFIQKYKSGLWVFYLNQRILESTNGDKNVNDFSRKLYEEFAGRNVFYTYQDIERIMSEVAGTDLEDLISVYAYTNETIPLDYYFQDDDGDGLKNGLEILLGYKPSLIDTDGDGLDDANDYARRCEVTAKNPQYCYDLVPEWATIPTETPTLKPTYTPLPSMIETPTQIKTPTITPPPLSPKLEDESTSAGYLVGIVIGGLAISISAWIVLRSIKKRREDSS